MVRTHTYKFKQKTNVLKHLIYVLILTWKPTRTRSKNNNNSRIILGILQKLEGKSLCGKNSFICTFTAHEGCESHYMCDIDVGTNLNGYAASTTPLLCLPQGRKAEV